MFVNNVCLHFYVFVNNVYIFIQLFLNLFQWPQNSGNVMFFNQKFPLHHYSFLFLHSMSYSKYSVTRDGSRRWAILPNRCSCGSRSIRCFRIAFLHRCFKFRFFFEFCEIFRNLHHLYEVRRYQR